MDVQSRRSPQARNNLVGPFSSTQATIDRRGADDWPHHAASPMLPIAVSADLGTLATVPLIVLARPYPFCAGFVQPALTSAAIDVLPAKVEGTPLPLRLQVGRCRCRDNRHHARVLLHTIIILRGGFGPGGHPGRHPGPEFVHALPGPGGPELGHRAVIVFIASLLGALTPQAPAYDCLPGPLPQELVDLLFTAENQSSRHLGDDDGVRSPLLTHLGPPQSMEKFRACAFRSALDSLVPLINPDNCPLPVLVRTRGPSDDGAAPDLSPLILEPLAVPSPHLEPRLLPIDARRGGGDVRHPY